MACHFKYTISDVAPLEVRDNGDKSAARSACSVGSGCEFIAVRAGGGQVVGEASG